MMNEFNLAQFHLLRPEWLLALLPLFGIAWLLLRRKLFSRSWQSIIDAELLPHVLIGKPGKHSRLPVVLFVLVGSLVIFALAGPVWSKLPQPVYREQSALVIALDLSRSMDAGDIKPSRLVRARYKISDILKQRQEGQTALIAYAASAFTVSPLTDDADTIDALLPSLTTDIMPAQGSRTDLALQQASELFKNAGIAHGDILLITDSVNADSLPVFEILAADGYRVSILATGTAEGAPVALSQGGFLKDAQGAIVVPRLDISSLRTAATRGGGRFSLLSTDDRDIKQLLAILDVSRLHAQSQQTERHADVWREQGPWLLLLAVPLAALAFRRGYLAILVALLLPYPPPADALGWENLWKNDNQIAAEKLARDQASEAARQFDDAQWKAAAHYKAGEYEQALQALDGIDSAEAEYNRGNALARLGRTQQAIDAYDRALQKNPQNEDAKYNKQLLEQQQQNQQQNQQKNNSQQDQQQDGQQQNNSQQQQNSQQSADKQQQDGSSQQQKDQQQGGQQDSNQAQDEQQQSAENARQQQEEQQKQQASQQNESDTDGDQQPRQQASAMERSQQELSQQAAEQWLRRIPDDPGGLLRRKFEYQYKRQQRGATETQPW